VLLRLGHDFVSFLRLFKALHPGRLDRCVADLVLVVAEKQFASLTARTGQFGRVASLHLVLLTGLHFTIAGLSVAAWINGRLPAVSAAHTLIVRMGHLARLLHADRLPQLVARFG